MNMPCSTGPAANLAVANGTDVSLGGDSGGSGNSSAFLRPANGAAAGARF